MEIIRDDGCICTEEFSAAAFGIMDGVHLGHRSLLETAVQKGLNYHCIPTLITLEPHPDTVLNPQSPLGLLTTLEEKAEVAASYGIERVIVQDFERICNMTPEEYFTDVVERFHIQYISVGENYTFGKGGRGSIRQLIRLCNENGVKLIVNPPVCADGNMISSTGIRMLLLEGKAAEAAKLLGRPWSVSGTVARGFGRGTGMGFPTVNLSLPEGKLIPANGVYVSRVYVGNEVWHSISNIGINPTFSADGSPIVLETFILDYTGESLYDVDIKVEFLEFLRGEHRFENPAALIAQVQKDIAVARKMHGLK